MNNRHRVALLALPLLYGCGVEHSPSVESDLEVASQALTGMNCMAAANDDNAAAGGKLGLSVRPLSPEEQREAETQGLLVLDTAGAAAKAGIQPGDVILALNGTPVKSVEELRALVAKADHHVALLIQRDDAKIFVPVNLG